MLFLILEDLGALCYCTMAHPFLTDTRLIADHLGILDATDLCMHFSLQLAVLVLVSPMDIGNSFLIPVLIQG